MPLLSKLLGSVISIFIGRLIDHTRTSQGKARPWILFSGPLLAVCGILLYLFVAKYALAQRGYFAVGGEMFFLLLPVLYYIVATMIRDIIRDIKDRKKH